MVQHKHTHTHNRTIYRDIILGATNLAEAASTTGQSTPPSVFPTWPGTPCLGTLAPKPVCGIYQRAYLPKSPVEVQCRQTPGIFAKKAGRLGLECGIQSKSVLSICPELEEIVCKPATACRHRARCRRLLSEPATLLPCCG